MGFSVQKGLKARVPASIVESTRAHFRHALFLCCFIATCAVSHTSLGAPVQLKYDDGSSEESVGQVFEGSIGDAQPETIWLNAFQAPEGAPTVITSVDIAFGKNPPDNLLPGPLPENGSPVKVYIWSDPTNDGDPSDAIIVAGPIATTVQDRDTDTFVNVALPDGLTFSAGDWFFAGFQSTVYAVGLDTSASQGRSWVAGSWSDSGLLAQPDNLLGAQFFGTIDDLVPQVAGNFLIRVNANQANATYRYDDGSSEESVGQVFEGSIGDAQPETIWLNAFQAPEGAPTVITSVDIAFGKNPPDNLLPGPLPENGSPVKVYIWSDPTNDGDPSDAIIVAGPIATTVQDRDTDTFVNVALPDGLTFSAGDWFFAGFQSTVYAVGLDTSASQGRSWVAGSWSDSGLLAQPDNLLGAQFFGTIDDLVPQVAGNFLIRVNANQANATYRYDDGSSEESVGQVFEGSIGDAQPETIWLNAFQAPEGAPTVITSVDIAFGKNPPDNLLPGPLPENGSPVKVYIWSDPTNDGDPSDAIIVAGPIATTVQDRDTDTFVNVALPDGLTFSAGDWFFAGFQSTVYAVGLDTSASQGRSWVAGSWSDSGLLAQPDNLLGAQFFGTIDDLVPQVAGNFLIRVFANGPKSDSDADGVNDEVDEFPSDPTEAFDKDADGIGDNSDIYPESSSEGFTDTDGDGAPDTCNQKCLDLGLQADPFVNAVTQKVVGDLVVKAEPVDPSSTAELMNVEPLPFEPPAGFTGVTTQVAFEVAGLSMQALETIELEIDFGMVLPPGASVYKVSSTGELTLIDGATIDGSIVRYMITDNDSALDADPLQGKISDPVTVGVMSGAMGPSQATPVKPVPVMPFWLFLILSLLLAKGGRHLRQTIR